MRITPYVKLTFAFSLVLLGGLFFNSHKAEASSPATINVLCNDPSEIGDWFTFVSATKDDDGYITIKFSYDDSADRTLGGFNFYGYDSSCVNQGTVIGGGSTFHSFDVSQGDIIGIQQITDTQFDWVNFSRTELWQTNFFNQDPDVSNIQILITGDGSNAILSENFDFPQRKPLITWSKHYINGFTNPDFEQWWYCVDLYDTDVTGYYVKVKYGDTSSLPSFANEDNLKDTFGLVPVYNREAHDCPLQNKETDLTPGDYSAKAELYDEEDNLLEETSIIDFHITAGEKTQVVNGGNSEDSARQQWYRNCEEKWSNFVTRDICKLVGFLLEPENGIYDTFTQKYTELNDVMLENVPFTYGAIMYNTLSTLDSDDTDTILTGVNVAVAGNNFDIPDWTLTEEQASLFDTFKSVMTVLLYVGLFSWLSFRAYRYFKQP